MDYSCLLNQSVSIDKYSIVPIRMEDRYKIMQWRNEQIYHLRQNKPLTEKEQDQYFNGVVAKLFEQDTPGQILFSYLESGECIGYGGLVHINWIDRNAEVSFIICTDRESTEFEKHWSIYLQLIEAVAFADLDLHKIYTYAFDIRPHLYRILESNAFKKEAVLKEHCLFNEEYRNVVIHSKINYRISLKRATIDDLDETFNWVSNHLIRQFSISKSEVTKEEHSIWFKRKIEDENCLYLIVLINENKIGSIRFDIINGEYALISYLLQPDWHGKGIGLQLLYNGINVFFSMYTISEVRGMVLKVNHASIKIFSNLGSVILKEDEDSILFSKYRII